MLLEIRSRLRNGILDDVIRNGLLEAFAVHARTLTEFLQRKHADVRDVHASHFFTDNNEWEKLFCGSGLEKTQR
jgi:hypothetical protein